MVSGSGSEGLLMGFAGIPGPEERERAACEAMAPQWAAMQKERQERDAAEAAAFAEMWAGIEVGDVVEVNEAEHVAGGGL